MKNILSCLGAAMLLIGCNGNTTGGAIHGHLSGMEAADSVVVYCNGVKDTIAAPHGKFTYAYTDTMAGIIRLLPCAKGPDVPRMPPITVMMTPGNTVEVDGDFYDPQVSGGDFYDEYNAMYKEIRAVDKERKAANGRYMKLVNAKASQADILRSFEELKVVDKEYQAHLERYIAGHLNLPVSLFLLANVHPGYGEKYITDFTENVKNGVMKDIYIATLTYYEKAIAKKQAAENIRAGKLAPDFTAKDLNGKAFTLSSLRGKYVVLDFWGSWCAWCVAGFPEMKHLYAKFSDRIEFVGIDCRDTEENWKAAVEKYALPWTQVMNSTEDFRKDLTLMYNVSVYPTKIIISPEGKIMEVVLGEDREFYDAIRFLMMD